MIRTSMAAAIAACALASVPMALEGQIVERIYGGVHAHGSNVTLRGGEGGSSFESGLGFRLGYFVTPTISTEARVSSALLRPALANPTPRNHSALIQTELLGRYHFQEFRGAWVPSVHAGLSWHLEHGRIPNSLRLEGKPYSSLGISVGSGVGYRVGSSASIDGAVTYAGGRFAGDECPLTVEGGTACPASARVDLGVTWYPSR